MYSIEVRSKGQTAFSVKTVNSEFVIDTGGKGVTPPDALLASLGSCVGVYIRKYLEGAKVGIRDFGVKVEADFCKDRPLRFSSISVAIDFGKARLEEFRRKALLEFIKNCPVHNTLTNNASVAFKLIEEEQA